VSLEAISLTLPETGITSNIETDIAPSIDVEITVYAGLDPLSEDLIEKAKRAAEKLSKEYGVLAVVVPITVSWCHLGSCSPAGETPQLVINGYPVDSVELDSETIVDISLALLNEKRDYGEYFRVKQDNSMVYAASLA